MPYIDAKARERLKNPYEPAKTVGELNYIYTQLFIQYFYCNGGRYQQIHDIKVQIDRAITKNIIGNLDLLAQKLLVINAQHDQFSGWDIRVALDLAFLEFYRRVAGPYEDQKKHENGDVYPAPGDLTDYLHGSDRGNK